MASVGQVRQKRRRTDSSSNDNSANVNHALRDVIPKYHLPLIKQRVKTDLGAWGWKPKKIFNERTELIYRQPLALSEWGVTAIKSMKRQNNERKSTRTFPPGWYLENGIFAPDSILSFDIRKHGMRYVQFHHTQNIKLMQHSDYYCKLTKETKNRVILISRGLGGVKSVYDASLALSALSNDMWRHPIARIELDEFDFRRCDMSLNDLEKYINENDEFKETKTITIPKKK
eukprot:30052_1